MAACGDEDEPEPTAETVRTVVQTQTQTQAPTQTQARTEPAAPRRLSTFRSPTGNIGCQMDAGNVRCDIRERSWSPPATPADCELDYGQGVSLGAGGAAELVCAGDTALDDGAPVLAYGDRSAAGDLTCSSEPAGMTCRDSATGNGFFLSRERYELLR
jgi:hypothetical protein